jgi:hypothetical protein
LLCAAQHQHDQALRRHVLDLAVTYQRAADQMVPQPEYATIE